MNDATLSTPQHLLAAYTAAVLARDVDAFVQLYDDEVQVFDTWGTWSYEGKTAWRPMIEGWFGSLGDERLQVDFREVKVTAAGDFAGLRATVVYTAVSAQGQNLRAMHNRLTWLLQRRGAAWSVLHEHTSVPVGFDDMKAILQRPGAF
ncbi:MAG: nuclear transport factor 2 family protein [Rubrivivax sp.]